MSSGYYAACAGLQAQTQALDLVANNLANVSTSGYRAQQSSFQSLLAGASGEWATMNPLNRAINDFNVIGDTRTDLRAGNLQHTGNPLDLAIEGSGFFAVQTAAGTLYTRNGNFRVSAKGQLTTSEGDLVLGVAGPIAIPSGEIAISPDGTISVNGGVAGKLRIVEFAPGSSPAARGNAFYSVPDAQAQISPDSSVREGMLESSNVNAVQAVVSLLVVQRQAEMMERAMSVFQSDIDRIAANELPKV